MEVREDTCSETYSLFLGLMTSCIWELCTGMKVAAGCLLQFARVLLQMVHPSAEKVTEEEWVGHPLRVSTGEVATHTFMESLHLQSLVLSREDTLCVP